MSAAHTPFHARFYQLARYENDRTPVLLLEDEYNRAKLCLETHDALVEALREVLSRIVPGSLASDVRQRAEEALRAATGEAAS